LHDPRAVYTFESVIPSTSLWPASSAWAGHTFSLSEVSGRDVAAELEPYYSARGARLAMTIRRLGRGQIVYLPVIFQGDLPRDERSAAVLFALAAPSSEPVPVVAPVDVLRLLSGSGGLLTGGTCMPSGSAERDGGPW
jgi:hypothetical protein